MTPPPDSEQPEPGQPDLERLASDIGELRDRYLLAAEAAERTAARLREGHRPDDGDLELVGAVTADRDGLRARSGAAVPGIADAALPELADAVRAAIEARRSEARVRALRGLRGPEQVAGEMREVRAAAADGAPGLPALAALVEAAQADRGRAAGMGAEVLAELPAKWQGLVFQAIAGELRIADDDGEDDTDGPGGGGAPAPGDDADPGTGSADEPVDGPAVFEASASGESDAGPVSEPSGAKALVDAPPVPEPSAGAESGVCSSAGGALPGPEPEASDPVRGPEPVAAVDGAAAASAPAEAELAELDAFLADFLDDGTKAPGSGTVRPSAVVPLPRGAADARTGGAHRAPAVRKDAASAPPDVREPEPAGAGDVLPERFVEAEAAALRAGRFGLAGWLRCAAGHPDAEVRARWCAGLAARMSVFAGPLSEEFAATARGLDAGALADDPAGGLLAWAAVIRAGLVYPEATRLVEGLSAVVSSRPVLKECGDAFAQATRAGVYLGHGMDGWVRGAAGAADARGEAAREVRRLLDGAQHRTAKYQRATEVWKALLMPGREIRGCWSWPRTTTRRGRTRPRRRSSGCAAAAGSIG